MQRFEFKKEHFTGTDSYNQHFLLPEKQAEYQHLHCRAILGELAQKMTDSQIQTTVSEFEFLGNEWLDEFERKAFGGKTLQELLQKS